jgi:heat shock 70kDa protein 1/2/6/8
MSSNARTATTDAHDDAFELYDLKVEVIVPPGAGGKIMCGAKEGDHFVLRGEMLHLPEGQGFSIYSLGGCTSPEPP